MGLYDDEDERQGKQSSPSERLLDEGNNQLRDHVKSSIKQGNTSGRGLDKTSPANNGTGLKAAANATNNAANTAKTAATATSASTGSSGAAAGATAGSVAPGVGNAIGAAAGKVIGDVSGNTIKREAEKKAGHSLKEVSEEKVTKKSKDKLGKKESAMADDDDVLVKIIATLIAVISSIVVIIVVVVMTVLLSVTGPVLSLYTMFLSGIDRCSDFFDLFDSDPTFADITAKIVDDLKSAFKTAYNDTCYQEVLQIAEEKEYNLELTIESYKKTEFPYDLDGDNCNINYAEILTVLTMSNKINCSVDEFEYSAFKKLLEDKEFLRTLYDLKVDPVNYLIIGLQEGESGSVDADGLVTITSADGSMRQYQGVKGIDYDTYGEVTVSQYPLKKVFDYFEVDPYAKNEIYPTMTNYNALGILNQTCRLYDKSAFWGTSRKSALFDYTVYTGEITKDDINEYRKEYIAYLGLTNPGDTMMVPLMLQTDPKWETDTDGSLVLLNDGTTVKKRGCCITCMAMVCTYLTGTEITPVDIIKCRVVTTGGTNKGMYGPLHRDVVSKAYGFHENILGKPTAQLIESMCSELDMQHPIILKMNTAEYKKIAYGSNPPTHFVVLTGWDAERQCFYVNDPAGEKGYYGQKSIYGGTIPFEQFASNKNLFMEARSYSID